MSHNFLNDPDDFPEYENIEGFDALNTSFTAEPLATFDLTPATGSDGMVFNLTPVNVTSVPGPAIVSPVPDLGNMYNRQLSNTINAMTFTPPPLAAPLVQRAPAPSITPDFTGLLPPPPPASLLAQSSSRPPPQLLSVSAAPGHVTSHMSAQQMVTSKHSVTPAMIPISSNVTLSPIHVSSPRHETSPKHMVSLSPQHQSQVFHQQQQQNVQHQLLHQQPVQLMRSPPKPPQQQNTTTLFVQDPGQLSQTLQQPPRVSPTKLQQHPQQQLILQKFKQQFPSHDPPPPPPYKSPPSYFPPQQVSPRQPSPQMSPNSVQIAPNVTLIKKQKSPKQNQPAASRPTPPPSYPGPPDTKDHQDPIMSPPQPPPPSYPSPSPSKLPSYSLEELQSLPGANLKKSSVDLNVYIAAMARNTHPEFANIDNFAERCLACIVRKIKTNLPTLRALMDSSAQGDDVPDPGCVLIPRMKDGRITIARPGVGGVAGGTKKIHPHLALVQIFRNPGVTNHNHLVSLSHCAAPFFARAGEPEGDMVCINPLHYIIDNGKMKSPALTKRKSNISSQLSSSNVLLGQMTADETRQKKDYPALIKSKSSPSNPGAKRQSAQSVESDDFLSDSDDDGIDWAKKWDEDRIVVEKTDVQEFNVDEIVKDIKFMSVAKNEEGLEETKETEKTVLEKLKIIEDYKNLLNGKYDLSQLKNLQKVKPRSNKHKSQQPVPQRKKPGPKPKKKLGETWISGGQSQSSTQPQPRGSSETSSKVKAAVNQVVTNRMVAENKIEKPVIKEEEEKDATVIQDLLEDIKGSFDSQFDMDMDSFGGAEASSDFGIGSEFNLGALEGFTDSNPAILDKNMPSAPGSSDAMFGGPSEPLNIPQYIPSHSQNWPQVESGQEDKSKESVSMGSSLMEDLSSLDLSLPRVSQEFYNPQPGGSADQFPMDQSEQRFPDGSFLPSGTMSQDQFFNIFDE